MSMKSDQDELLVDKDSVFLKNASVSYLTKQFTKFILQNYGGKDRKIDLPNFRRLAAEHDTILKEYFKEFK